MILKIGGRRASRVVVPRVGLRTMFCVVLVVGLGFLVIIFFQFDVPFQEPLMLSSTRRSGHNNNNNNNNNNNAQIIPRVERIAAVHTPAPRHAETRTSAVTQQSKHTQQSSAAFTPCSLEYTKRVQEHQKGLYVITKKYQLPATADQALRNHSDFLFTTKWGQSRRFVSVSDNDARLLHAVVRDACRHAIRRSGTCTTAETGFALARSTIAILEGQKAAVSDVINSKDSNDITAFPILSSRRQMAIHSPLVHYAVDPFQQELYEDAGRQSVAHYLNDLRPLSSIIPEVLLWRETAAFALASWMTTDAAHSCFDVLFMDDGHNFEQNIIELSLAIPLIPIGGIVILHDIWMASVQAARSWIDTNLPDVLQPVKQRVSPNMLVFIKVAQDKRKWDHFIPFDTQFNNTHF